MTVRRQKAVMSLSLTANTGEMSIMLLMCHRKMRRLLCLPRRVCDAVENANRGISEIRLGITSVLLPLKVLIWISIAIVSFDMLRGTSIHHSVAYRMVVGAIDQLWYTIFYFSIPFLWNRSRVIVERIGERRDWIVVQDTVIVARPSERPDPNPSPEEPRKGMEAADEDEWVLVDWSDIAHADPPSRNHRTSFGRSLAIRAETTSI